MIEVRDWRCFPPRVRLFFESSADESRVRIVGAFDLFLDVAGIDEGDGVNKQGRMKRPL